MQRGCRTNRQFESVWGEHEGGLQRVGVGEGSKVFLKEREVASGVIGAGNTWRALNAGHVCLDPLGEHQPNSAGSMVATIMWFSVLKQRTSSLLIMTLGGRSPTVRTSLYPCTVPFSSDHLLAIPWILQIVLSLCLCTCFSSAQHAFFPFFSNF